MNTNDNRIGEDAENGVASEAKDENVMLTSSERFSIMTGRRRRFFRCD